MPTFKYLKYLLMASCLSASIIHAGTIDDMSRSVVFLSQNLPVVEDINGIQFQVWLKVPGTNAFIPKQRRITGSGFIVTSSNICYLITAKHVATNMTEDCQIVMRGVKLEPLRFTLSSITGQPSIRWFHHSIADVSIYPLPTITSQGLLALNRRALPMEFLESSETNLPSRDAYVTVLGFPLGLGAEGEFIPLSRDTKASSGMLHDGAGSFFLLQDPGVSGYSGGPLIQSGDARFVGNAESIAVISGGSRCWGFVSATFGDETGGKMCRITPAVYAVELIHKAQRELKIWQADSPSTEKK